ncbi:hypothetical protein J3Q64DRAFT_1633709 [Phycomyces blakesleeanus]|uniref:Pentatricopeptide repeat-containing protein-mitochondrial domain-containing protein n=1 Tax=Phycomyces blakesleeanus TaxID=4837 RepID=A0ABR3BAH3_PHYBL
MRKLDHQWSILEYNDYFMVKLYQSKYNDILNMYKGEFQQKGIPLSVGSFNVILATYIMVGDTQSAAELVKKMVRGDVVPSIRDFERTMRRCMPHNATIVETAKALISDHGFTTTRILDTNLIHLFGEKRAEDVRRLYLAQKSRKLDLSTYGILLRGFVDSRQIKVAQSIYEDMVNAGVKPSTFVCSTMLTVFTHRRDVASAEKIIQETLKNGHELDITIYTQLIKVYFKARQTAKAFHVFNEIQKSPSMKLNDVVLNTMIDGLVINREMEAAKLLYDQMLKSSIQPDMVTFNTLLKGFIKANDHASAAAVMTDMQKLQLNPDTITFTTMIEAVLSSKQPSSAQESLQMLTTAGMRPNIYTFNAMLNWWVKAQNMREAERTLDILKSPPYNFHPTVHTYTNMLQGYAETMDLPKAMQTFQTMLRSDQKPDRAAFHFMIVSFLRASRLQDAMVCVKRMRAMDVNPTKDTWMLLLDECHLRRDWVVGAEVVQELDASGALMALPNELLLYVLRRYLDLGDLWQLLQVSRDIRFFAMDTIHTRWKFEVTPSAETTMKVQCRAALIALESLSCQLSLQTRVYTLQYPHGPETDLMQREERLHQRIIRGISSYKHKYVLIEDIDIRNRIRSAVDVIFHHAVFVAALSRSPVRLACTHASSNNRALAAMIVRLLTRLDAAFPSYCREITYTLADNIKAFLEYTGYKLLAMNQQHDPLVLYNMVISACFDLMGAAFIGKILSESHVECAVQRTCELLSDDHLRSVKRALLVDLLEGWLTIKRGLVAGELCRLVRLEIDKCDRHGYAAPRRQLTRHYAALIE